MRLFNLFFSIPLIVTTLHAQGQVLSHAVDSVEIADQINHFLILYSDSSKAQEVQLLLEYGANPNATTYDGYTALMYASQNGSLEIVNLLLEYGADVNIKPSDGNTALHAASRSENDSIAEILILNGARVNEPNFWGTTPLHLSAAYGYVFLTKLLIFYEANLDAQDSNGNTPLMGSIFFGAGRTSQILLVNGAQPDLADKQEYTPLMVACQFNDTILFDLLVEYGADPLAKTFNGIDGLSLAITHGANDIVGRLIALGAAKEPLADTKSYLQLAQLSGNVPARSLLKGHIKKSYSPKIGRIGVFTSTFQNSNDFFWGGGLSVFEVNYGFRFAASFAFRPFNKAVLLEQNDVFYQYYERRRFLNISACSPIANRGLANNGRLGLEVGLAYMYSWGNFNYHNAKNRPPSLSALSPTFGMYYEAKGFRTDISIQPFNIFRKEEYPFLVGVSLVADIDIFKPVIKPKKINRL